MFNGVEPIGATYGLPFFSEIQIPEFIRVYGGVKNIAMLLIVGMVVTLAPNVHQIKIKDKKEYRPTTDYKPTGNLIYSDNLIKKIEDRTKNS